jgi:thymidylate kinase
MLTRVVSYDPSLAAPENSARGVLGQWRDAGIPYCALRDRLEREPAGDLDLLIDESSVDRSRQWLEEHGFVAVPGASPFKMVMLRYLRGQAVCLDIHWKAVQYGIVYMDAHRMLERRVECDGIFYLSPEDELIHLVAHNFLRKGALREPALQRIRALLNLPIDTGYLGEHLDAFGLRAAFDAAIAWVQKEDAAGDATHLRKRLLRSALRARAGNTWRYLTVRYGLRRDKRRGGLVVLVGPDGSGKSTVTRTLIQRARAIPSLKIDTTYLGPWGQMQLPLVPALRKLGITPTVEPPALYLADESPLPRRSWMGSIVKGYLFYAALYIELVYRYMRQVFFSVRKGHWVLADRYITDLRYLYKERPIRNYGVIRRLLCRLYPKPDLLIVLDNRADVIVSRKSGLAAAQIETLRHYCLEAARAYRFEVVTTDRTPDEIADHVLNRMLSLRALK